MRKKKMSRCIVAVLLSCLMAMSTVSTAIFATEDTEAKAYTRQASDAQRYTVALPAPTAGYAITTDDALELEQGQTFTFTITISDGYMKLKSFKVKANGNVLTPNEEGVYEVEIQDHTTITVEGVTKISYQESDFVTVKAGGITMTYREGVVKIINRTFTIEAGGKLINQGTIIVKGIFTNDGTLDNQGKLYMEIGSTLVGNRPDNMVFRIGWDVDGDGMADIKEYVSDGETTSHADALSKPADKQYIYTFDGWSSDGGVTTEEVGAVTQAKLYTPVFSKELRRYTVNLPANPEGYTIGYEGETSIGYDQTFAFTVDLMEGYLKTKDFVVKANDTVLEPVDGRYEVTVQGETEITVEGIRTIEYQTVENLIVDRDDTYTIPEHVFVTVTGNMVVNGTLDIQGTLVNNGTKENTCNGTITNKGTFTNNKTLEMGLGSEYNGVKPDNLAYEIGWDTDGDGKVDDTDYVADGLKPTHEAGNKEADKEYTYTFIGWSVDGGIATEDIGEATEPKIYTAQFTATPRLYTVTLPENQMGYAIRHDGKTEVGYDQPFTFTVDVQNGYVKTKDFAVKANGMVLTPNEDGTYEAIIQGHTEITIEGVKAASQPATADQSDVTLWHWLLGCSLLLLVGSQWMKKKQYR